LVGRCCKSEVFSLLGLFDTGDFYFEIAFRNVSPVTISQNKTCSTLQNSLSKIWGNVHITRRAVTWFVFEMEFRSKNFQCERGLPV